MRFEWDEAKRQSNRQKHNLDFADAKLIFDGPIFTFEDDRFDYGEDLVHHIWIVTRCRCRSRTQNGMK